jgi:hypothetical protein
VNTPQLGSGLRAVRWVASATLIAIIANEVIYGIQALRGLF